MNLNSKKAQNWVMDTMPFFILFAAAVGFSIILFLLIVNSFILRNVEIPKNVEETILMERFYNSAECFAYKDETERVYQKIIDWNKFKGKEITSKCFSSINSKYAFKLEIENPESSGKFSVRTSNWIEGANFKSEQKNVFVHFDNKVLSRTLSIFIQNA